MAAGAAKTTSKKVSASKSRPASRNGSGADSRPKKQTVASPRPQPTPSQGYEAEPEIVGTPVTPPSSTELVGAVAELAGELVQTGVAAGGRLLKGALSRLTGAR